MPALIPALFGAGGPPAVARLVVAIIVDSVERQHWRRGTHIREEVLKFAPTFTNSDASSAVMLPLFCVGVRAALPHSPPASVDAGVCHPVSQLEGWGAVAGIPPIVHFAQPPGMFAPQAPRQAARRALGTLAEVSRSIPVETLLAVVHWAQRLGMHWLGAVRHRAVLIHEDSVTRRGTVCGG